METIQIPSLNLMLRQFRQMDSYTRYCSLLKQYAAKPYFIHGVPAPCFVARMFASHQRHDPLFGIYEVKEFLQPIATSTFFLTLQTPGNTKFENGHKVKDTPTFGQKTVRELEVSYSKLLKNIAQHDKIIRTMRQHQQESWKLQEHMNQRKSKLNSFLTSLPDKDDLAASTVYQIKFAVLKNKKKRATESYLSAVEKLNNSIRTEKEIRQNIHEMSTRIKETVLEMGTKSMTKAYDDMVEVISSISHQEGFNHTMNQLWNVDVCKIVKKLFDVCSINYITPIPEEFIAGTGYHEIIPKISETKPEYSHIWEKKVFPRNFNAQDQQELNNQFDDDEESTNDCFFDKDGGVKTVLKKNLPPGPMYGIIDIRKDCDAKMKLSLWDNTIGFGWTKKRSLFSKKIWGFFYITENGGL